MTDDQVTTGHLDDALRASAPGPEADGLMRARPADVDVDGRAVVAFLDAMRQAGLELNSFMLFRRGAVAAEGWWWPYRPSLPHMLHSATKSFVGAGIGIAVGEGLLKLTDPILKFFSDRISNPSANLRCMTVEHLLTQTSGHAIGISGSQWRPLKSSWITEFLKVPVPYSPGTHFAYSSATSFMLSAIITQIAGMPLSEYLAPRLFAPLGIRNYHWDLGPENINPGGNGLSTTTADFLKLGVLFLQGGNWNGHQVIPADWADASGRPTHGNPYGYQWWADPGGAAFFAAGKFGQFVFVFPALRAVLALTAGVQDNRETREKIQKLAFKHIVRICKKTTSSSVAEDLLRERLEGLRILSPFVRATSPLEGSVDGRMFHCDPNGDEVKSLKLTFGDDRAEFELVDHRGRHCVVSGIRDWVEGETTITGGYLHHEYEPGRMRVVARGRWVTESRFEMVWQFVETGFRDTVSLTFCGDAVSYEREVNVNSGELKRPLVTGRMA